MIWSRDSEENPSDVYSYIPAHAREKRMGGIS